MPLAMDILRGSKDHLSLLLRAIALSTWSLILLSSSRPHRCVIGKICRRKNGMESEDFSQPVHCGDIFLPKSSCIEADMLGSGLSSSCFGG